MSLFVTELAFTDELLGDQAKIGIFIGSMIAGVLGYTLLRRGKTPEEALVHDRELIGIDYQDELALPEAEVSEAVETVASSEVASPGERA